MTIWPSTAVPGVIDDGPDNAVELGVKFKSDVAGTITGIRFYKADANTGIPHRQSVVDHGHAAGHGYLLQRDRLGMAASALCHARGDHLQYGLRGLVSREQRTL